MDLVEKVITNPWLTAYEYTRGEHEAREVANALKILLLQPYMSKKYLTGLEFLKALKSQLPPNEFMRILGICLDEKLLSKLINETEPRKIIKTYKENYGAAMGLITILEILPVLRKTELLVQRIIEIIGLIREEIGEDSKAHELCRALIYGPIASIPPSKLLPVIEEIMKLPGTPGCLMGKIDFLTAVPDIYPPKMLQESRDTIEKLGDLLHNIAEELLVLVEKDPDTAVDAYYQLGLFNTRMNALCRMLGDWTSCRIMKEKGGETLARALEAIGKILVMINEADNSSYNTSS